MIPKRNCQEVALRLYMQSSYVLSLRTASSTRLWRAVAACRASTADSVAKPSRLGVIQALRRRQIAALGSGFLVSRRSCYTKLNLSGDEIERRGQAVHLNGPSQRPPKTLLLCRSPTRNEEIIYIYIYICKRPLRNSFQVNKT